ncbi:nucleoporin [Mucidula mucida]|nr:nucleoporin [Mucidula mucida]
MASAFASSSTSPLPANVPDLTVLQNASRVLHEQFASDAQIIPDLGETLNTQAGPASSSYSVFADDFRVPFQKRKLIGIPDALFKHYQSVKANSHMGIIPEIERVWISIEHKLLLWDYTEGQEISSFEDQPYVINHVAIVKPKKALFIEEISYLLVICTPVAVTLIGVAQTPVPGTRRKTLTLYATDLTVNTEVEMASVIGTPDGRIFMSGSHDGNLYELHYQSTESWFGKRVQLINHSVGGMSSLIPRFASSNVDDRIVLLVADNCRHCFYTLTEKNTISVYKPGTDKVIQHVQTLSNIYKSVQDKAPGSPALTPQKFQIFSIHPIDPAESRSGVQMVAVTTTGVRLYFAPSMSYGYSYGSMAPAAGNIRPLALLHVRLPPTNLLHPDEQEMAFRPPTAFGAAPAPPPQATRPYVFNELDNSSYVDGLMIAAQPGDGQDNDHILCVSPDLARIGNLEHVAQAPPPPRYMAGTTGKPPLTEYATILSIPGRTWGMAVVPTNITAPDPNLPATPVTNELATQFSEYPRQFMILTNAGLHFLVKRRALDYVKAVLEEWYADGNLQPMVEMRDSFGRTQTCAILLGLASGNSFLPPAEDAQSSSHGVISPDLANLAKQAFYDLGERPRWTERSSNVYSKTDTPGQAEYSGRRDGLALYFARLVRPIWKVKITTPIAPGIYLPTVPEKIVMAVQKNLTSLKDFLDRNPHIFHLSPSDSAARAPSLEQEAWKAEQTSVTELLSLLTRTIEALSFVLLLTDYNISDLVIKCPPDIQKMFTPQTFEDLITSQNGMTVSRALVNVVIDQQIGQQLSVDTISEVLQQRCGSFCSSDDVMLYKAKENIRKAVETRNTQEREIWLSDSLRLYIKGARILDLEKLREICGDFQQLTFARGAVELPLACANVFDPDNVGLSYWANGAPPNDPRKEFYDRRIHCYELVLDSLRVFEENSTANNNAMSSDDPDVVRTHAYEYALASPDETFHSTLYDWLIERGMADDLLEIRPIHLESHLRREPATVKKYQLLWQFYVKDGQPLRAAEVLSVMAQSTDFNLRLNDRLECLTLAVGNAKSHPVSSTGRIETAIEFLSELEEKLDVAKVQLDVFNLLRPHMQDDPTVGQKIALLDTRLFDISEIFFQYGLPFDYPDIKLLCLYTSEHRDENLVRSIWKQIFDDITASSENPADDIRSKVVDLGSRFFPSESAFPLRLVTDLLVRFSLERSPGAGWVPQLLAECRIPYVEIWDILNDMYESHIPPFNAQANVQAISSDIAVLLLGWLEAARRPNSTVGRSEVPVGRMDSAVDKYLRELDPSRTETKQAYEDVKRC